MLHSGGHWEPEGQRAYIEEREVQIGYKEKIFTMVTSPHQTEEQLAKDEGQFPSSGALR